jgi:hypothetical protein
MGFTLSASCCGRSSNLFRGATREGAFAPAVGLLEVPSPWHADKAFAGNLKEVHEVLRQSSRDLSPLPYSRSLLRFLGATH